MNQVFANQTSPDKAAEFLKSKLQPGLWVRLEGPLGVGKTTLVRRLFELLGFEEPVRSPSFPLVLEYDLQMNARSQKILHLDGFRLSKNQALPVDPSEHSAAIFFVEWAENFAWPLEKYQIHARLSFEDSGSRCYEFSEKKA